MLIRQQQGTTQTARYIFAGGDYSLGKTLPGHGAPHNANQQQNQKHCGGPKILGPARKFVLLAAVTIYRSFNCGIE